ncbi:hypothetical protein [Nocardia sp. NPDC052566]|uniref:hypothetical protein n=1 Tax=Nocardia sp. NPDC052566 TaxID=3364330 RepID=UPI0037C61744
MHTTFGMGTFAAAGAGGATVAFGTATVDFGALGTLGAIVVLGTTVVLLLTDEALGRADALLVSSLPQAMPVMPTSSTPPTTAIIRAGLDVYSRHE